jgi:hypothetical protein
MPLIPSITVPYTKHYQHLGPDGRQPYAVEKDAAHNALEGAIDQLKESVIGRAVYDRGPNYDPRTDSIVRVESLRLRRRLHE